MGDQKQEEDINDIKDRKNWFEWLVFSVGLLLVLSIIGYLVYQTYHRKTSSPDLVAESYPDPSRYAPYRYRVVLHNKGGETAEQVKLEVEVQVGGEAIETADLDFPFAPQESMREGWVNFDKDPTLADTVKVKVVSYKRP
ncbi:hypothetical protein [Pontibacter mangrovi]|uniref:TIGR02588 family protein n=1 Tax=Pontibacter mangrovi TaxID=2589816 RepID=A0A501WC60_9BACT|nr:hypothetical protein [Pontibacter mangrovi]TPE46392.1 hypothetical protein FJM65_03360 [Pontibacter mangrovi]